MDYILPEGAIAEIQGASQMALRFKSWNSEKVYIEYAQSGDDLILHAWPAGNETRFREGFLEAFEKAVQEALPEDTRVDANYTDYEEARLLATEDRILVPQRDLDLPEVQARETVHLKIHEVMARPLAELIVESRLQAKLLLLLP